MQRITATLSQIVQKIGNEDFSLIPFEHPGSEETNGEKPDLPVVYVINGNEFILAS